MVKNPESRGWIVQKFGGTSVGKFPDMIAEGIVRYEFLPCWGFTEAGMLTQGSRNYVENNRVVVVCSARSTGKKVTGTTSR